MIHSRQSSAVLLVASLCVAASADSAQPPDVVQSDGLYNTAMGTNALANNNSNSNTAAGLSSLQFNTTGYDNSAFGSETLYQNTSGYENSAFGAGALQSANGVRNSAFGMASLSNNVSGSYNTAVGAYSLWLSYSGSNNTATGHAALYQNAFGSDNTATGISSLQTNQSGNDNTATGAQALFANTSGNNNTASGYGALYSNTNGASNTASGNHTLYYNTTGFHDTAAGAEALFTNSTGDTNTAIGFEALYSNTTGSNNIAIGNDAAYNLTSGSNNIDIGNEGVAGESAHIRIGTASTQTTTFIAGIENSKVTGSAVYVTSSGQLGVLASSERYKTDIVPIGSITAQLLKLRPVAFHLKTEPNGAMQYGLIAEEVNQVYPELVIRDEAGAVQGVRYDELAPMLLNQVQQQQKVMEMQAQAIRELQQAVAELRRHDQSVQAAMAKSQANDPRVAMR
jgi:trimeric autotransporter adhesin